jgi:hypothetical protein
MNRKRQQQGDSTVGELWAHEVSFSGNSYGPEYHARFLQQASIVSVLGTRICRKDFRDRVGAVGSTTRTDDLDFRGRALVNLIVIFELDSWYRTPCAAVAAHLAHAASRPAFQASK